MVTRLTLKREVRGSNLGCVKSEIVLLPMACHRCDIFLEDAMARKWARQTRFTLQRDIYNKNNKKFHLIDFIFMIEVRPTTCVFVCTQ